MKPTAQGPRRWKSAYMYWQYPQRNTDSYLNSSVEPFFAIGNLRRRFQQLPAHPLTHSPAHRPTPSCHEAIFFKTQKVKLSLLCGPCPRSPLVWHGSANTNLTIMGRGSGVEGMPMMFPSQQLMQLQVHGSMAAQNLSCRTQGETRENQHRHFTRGDVR